MRRGGGALFSIAFWTFATVWQASGQAWARTAVEVLGPAGILPLTTQQPPARIIVDAPLPGPLRVGNVCIQCRAVNLRILPVFGREALKASHRIGHINVVVDGAA